MAEQVTVREVMAGLEVVAPLGLAEGWDKVGLQVGDPDAVVSRGLLCIDLTEAVVAEALEAGCGLVVAYHPPIFGPLTGLVEGAGSSWKARALVAAVRAGLAVYSPHTALDAVRGGVNDWLCGGLGEGVSEPIERTVGGRDEYKVVVYVPAAEVEVVRGAMTDAGAGGIGKYSGCSFGVAGEGTFEPGEGARPAVGEVGRFERVAEVRLEMICGGRELPGVLSAARGAHSYEEPAVDVFRLEAEPVVGAEAPGSGRLLRLAEAVTVGVLAERVKARLGVERVKVAGAGGVDGSAEPGGGDPRALAGAAVRTVAVCVGAGGKLFEGVEADAYVTGEMQHHQVLDLAERGKGVVLAGHTQTERPYLPVYRERLCGAVDGVEWRVSEKDRAPLRFC
ncbi:MAG: Nif3-like dinuclear metal center hexameric protein [Planctomycetota bacterium]